LDKRHALRPQTVTEAQQQQKKLKLEKGTILNCTVKKHVLPEGDAIFLPSFIAETLRSGFYSPPVARITSFHSVGALEQDAEIHKAPFSSSGVSTHNQSKEPQIAFQWKLWSKTP